MVRLSEKARKMLKEPLGRVYASAEDMKAELKGLAVVSVGDVCTIALLDAGIMPHLAVFDFVYMRKEIPANMRKRLEGEFPDAKGYSNAAGEVSDRFSKDAAKLLEEGGAVFIDGEEDLTAVPLVMGAKKGTVIVYGQPGKGIVLVLPDEKTKRRLKEILSA